MSNKKTVWVADFETTTAAVNPNESHVWVWGFKGTLKGDRLVWGINLFDFFDKLKEYGANFVLFHNLSFDGNYIYKFLLDEAGFKFHDAIDGENKPLEENYFSWLNDERDSLFSLKVNWKGFIIEFQDSYKILVTSVDKLGKLIGGDNNKMDLDYDEYTVVKTKSEIPKKAIAYLERDIDIVIKSINRVSKIYSTKMTRAGMAENSFKEFYGERSFSYDFGGLIYKPNERKRVWHNVLSKEDWEFVKRSYQGGYTNWNQQITNKEIKVSNGISYDINSLYPYIMMDKKMPYGKLYFFPPLGDYVKIMEVTIIKAKLKDKRYPALIKDKYGFYRAKKYLSEVENTTYVFWEEEFNFIKDKYDMTYKIGEVRYIKTKHVFTDWLEEKKQLKINATNEIDRAFHKGIINSTYGKFGQHYISESRIIVEDGNFVKELKNGERHLYKREKGNSTFIKKLSAVNMRYGPKGIYTHATKAHESDRFKYIPIASYVTSQARLKLWKSIFDNLDIWLYSDTDSCYYSDDPIGLEIHDSKFGSWKPEHKFNRFKVLRAKAYIFDATHEYKGGKWVNNPHLVRKVSGVSNYGKELINFETFYMGGVIKNGKRGVKNVKGGKIIYEADFKLGESPDEEAKRIYLEKRKAKE